MGLLFHRDIISKMVDILDTTLREGDQTPGIKSFTTSGKLIVAEMLDDYGVDFIEVGHPAVSETIMKDCIALSSHGLKAKTLAHARATIEDVDKAARTGANWVGIFMGVNDFSIRYRLGKKKDIMFKELTKSIEYAKAHGLKVRYTPEDSSRTPLNVLEKAYNTALEAGADRLSFADTVGCMTPLKMYETIGQLKKDINADFHVHCHNDFGLATANSFAAFEAGACCIDVTVNGLGERNGIASQAEVCTGLAALYGINKWKIDKIIEISRAIEKITGLKESHRAPIVGSRAFSHVAGLHTSALLKNARTYQFMDPKIVGGQVKLHLNQFTNGDTVKKVMGSKKDLQKYKKRNKQTVWNIEN